MKDLMMGYLLIQVELAKKGKLYVIYGFLLNKNVKILGEDKLLLHGMIKNFLILIIKYIIHII